MPRLAVAGYYGYGNTGDEAILESILTAVRSQVPGASFSVLTNDPPGTQATYGVDAVPRFSPFAVIRAIRDCDMLLFGGGSLLQDQTSLRSLFYYLSVLLAAQVMGKPAMVYANGVGPLRSAVGRLATRLILGRVSAITLRDADSAEQVKMLGVTRPEPRVTADPAFALEPVDPSTARAILEAEGVGDTRPLVGISLRPWRDSPRLGEVISEACDQIRDRLGAEVMLIPMQHSQDVQLARSVAASARRRVAILERPCTPRELMACIGLMEVVLGMRLHSLVFAVAMGVPAAGIAYDPKVEALLNAAGCPSLGSPSGLSPGAITSCVQHLLDNNSPMRERLQSNRERFRDLALENARIARSLIGSAVHSDLS